MVELDEQEVKILRELVKNPRLSDNKIAKQTKIPLMTVNRKRKKMEKEGMISYYVDISHSKRGTNDFNSKQFYIVKFRSEVTKKALSDIFLKDAHLRKFCVEHIPCAYLGEKDGRLALIIIVNAESESDLIDSFNGKIIPLFKKHFGEDCIIDIITTRIVDMISVHHNYFPYVNMEHGVIQQNWQDDWIFIDRKSFEAGNK
jgi:DNA-binding Lrp family transcriptional regulator